MSRPVLFGRPPSYVDSLPAYEEAHGDPAPSYEKYDRREILNKLDVALRDSWPFSAHAVDDHLFVGQFAAENSTGNLIRFAEFFYEWGLCSYKDRWITIVVRRQGTWPAGTQPYKILAAQPKMGVGRMRFFHKFWEGFYVVVVDASALSTMIRELIENAATATAARNRRGQEACELTLFNGYGRADSRIAVRDSELRKFAAMAPVWR